jgi:hypothetical protein
MKISCNSIIVLFFAALIFAAGSSAAQTIGDREVTTVSAGQANLADSWSTVSVTVKSEKDLRKKLEINGVHPDADSLSVIYSINPQIESTDNIKNATIVIPTVSGGNAPAKLVVDQAMKQSIRSMGVNVKNVANDPESWKLSDISPGTATAAAASIQSITSSFDTLPVSREFLEQTQSDTTKLATLIQQNQLSAVDHSLVTEILADLSTKSDWYKKNQSDPLVHVKALDSRSGKQIALLTICYVQALDGGTACANSFERPTSDAGTTDHRLPVARYYMWAADATGQSLCPAKPVDVLADVDVTLLLVGR